MMRGRHFCCVAPLVCAIASTTFAGSHLWEFNEVFSNSDGTIQFVEMHERLGAAGEVGLLGKWVLSDATGHEFVFPENLVPPTSDKYLLLATAQFATLPGAPTPDYIIPDGFFSLGDDTLRYWTYPTNMSWIAGDVPTDGVLSLNKFGTPEVNSPTNYAGETGSVDAMPPVPATSDWGLLALGLSVAVVGTIVLMRRHSQRRGATS